MKPTLLAGFLPAFLLLPALRAETAGLDREAAIGLALRENPELQAARLEIDRAQSRFRWAGRLANPELELEARDDFLGENEGESVLELAFSQRFPITSALRDEKELRRQQIGLAELEFAARQRQLAYEVDKAWIALAVARRTAELRNGLSELNRQVVTLLENRAAVGEGSPLDVTQASLEGRLNEQEAAIAEREVDGAEARLRQLAGVGAEDATFSIAGPTSLPADPPTSAFNLGKVLGRRPDFSALLQRRTVGEARLALAEAKRWEDVGVSLFLERETSVDAPEGRGSNTLAGIGFSFPLPLRDKNEAAIEEAQLDIAQAGAARAAGAFAIESEVKAALQARASAYRLANSSKGELLALANRNFEETRGAHEQGQASLVQVQRAQEQLLRLETAAVDLLKAYLEADADVRFATSAYPLFPASTTSSPGTK